MGGGGKFLAMGETEEEFTCIISSYAFCTGNEDMHQEGKHSTQNGLVGQNTDNVSSAEINPFAALWKQIQTKGDLNYSSARISATLPSFDAPA